MHLLTFSLPVMWLIILVVLALAEAATINLVSIWFAAGALTALLISLFCLSSRLHPVSGTGAAAGPEEIYPAPPSHQP